MSLFLSIWCFVKPFNQFFNWRQNQLSHTFKLDNHLIHKRGPCSTRLSIAWDLRQIIRCGVSNQHNWKDQLLTWCRDIDHLLHSRAVHLWSHFPSWPGSSVFHVDWRGSGENIQDAICCHARRSLSVNSFNQLSKTHKVKTPRNRQITKSLLFLKKKGCWT